MSYESELQAQFKPLHRQISDLRSDATKAAAERETMLAFMKELSDALISIRPLGGSELFVKRFDRYFADPAYCKAAIKHDADGRHEAMLERARAERNRDMWKSQCERQAEQLSARCWQPIATAPKDGSDMLLWHGCVVKGGWTHASIIHDGQAGWMLYGGRMAEPTHWMPIPEGPPDPGAQPRTSQPDTGGEA